MAKKELTKEEVLNLIGIGFCQPKFYKPSAWKKAKEVMEVLCYRIRKTGVKPHDFGRGKGKYTSDDSKSHSELADMYLAYLAEEAKKLIIWEGERYFGIEQFDGIVVDLYTTENKEGGYFTSLPISPLSYRKKSPTKARVIFQPKKENGFVVIDIYNDWGSMYQMKIHESLTKEIEDARAGAEKHGLL